MTVCAHPDDRMETLFPARDYISGHDFVIARCGVCGLTLTRPQPAPEQMSGYYPPGYYGDLADQRFPGPVEVLQLLLYDHRARAISKRCGAKRGRVLDIGCGSGLLLDAFRRRGWEVQGTELSEKASARAREHLKLPVHVGPMEKLAGDDGQFDAVVMWHVLEHLPQPLPALREVARVLRPGGTFFVGVPNFGSPEARLTRDKWFHLDVPRHLTQFTTGSLVKALEAEGFEIRRISHIAPEYDVFSFVQSALNRIGIRHNFLYNFLRQRGAKVVKDAQDNKMRWMPLTLTVLLGLPLGLLSLPVTVLAGLLGLGSTVTVQAVKREA